MCSQTRPLRGPLAMLILLVGLALCANACGSTKRQSGLLSDSLGARRGEQIKRAAGNNPTARESASPQDAAPPMSAAASRMNADATQQMRSADKPTGSTSTAQAVAGEPGAASASTHQSPSMTLITTTTQPAVSTFDRRSRIWPFFVGVGIALAAGLILLFRPSLLRAR